MDLEGRARGANGRVGHGRPRETAAERAFVRRWLTLAQAYAAMTRLELPPEPGRAPRRRPAKAPASADGRGRTG